MFEHDHSAARGEMASRKLIVFKHGSALGNAPAHALFERIRVGRNIDGEFRNVDDRGIDNAPPARKFSDYVVEIDRAESARRRRDHRAAVTEEAGPGKMSSEQEPIPLSALQHAVYCLRQAALIHLERLWEENRFTAEGHVLHVAADKPGGRRVRGVRRVTALAIGSPRLGIAGVADLVEFREDDGGEIRFSGGIQARQAEAPSRRRGAALRAGALS